MLLIDGSQVLLQKLLLVTAGRLPFTFDDDDDEN